MSGITTDEIIKIFEEIALMLELKGENPFKARSYEAVARNLKLLEEDLTDLVEEEKLGTIRGVGGAIGKKIEELVRTGRLEYYEHLKASIPLDHFEMLRIPGLGPKKIKTLYDHLNIETVGELEYACKENRLIELSGFGRKTQAKILEGIRHMRRYRERRLYPEVIGEGTELLKFLASRKEVGAARLGGSLRRGYETVKDIDLLAMSQSPGGLADDFVALPVVESTLARGKTKVSVVLTSGVNCDLRIVSPAEFPYALHHFTGSREHNAAMRSRAKQLGFKLNEYGLFRGKESIPCESERDIFRTLGLAFIPPELRENMGEIEAAEKNELPRLIEERDIRGLFHIHTRASDGAESLETLVKLAKEQGYDYIGISDHSGSAFYAGGLSTEAVLAQRQRIDELNLEHAPFRIFKGIESEILPDGRLDYVNEVLAGFDFVIAAVHSHFGMSEAEMTRRIVKALMNPFTTILAHPTGRLLLAREAYQVNMTEVIDAAAEGGKVLELNINPERLDLDWRNCIVARRKGVKIALGSDIHHREAFGYLPLGIKIARKGWIGPQDCINTLSAPEVAQFLARMKTR
ncbi:MAG: DNA polymerase/3'-5' exonuclease PolX [Syntrophales bacterium]|nr:DNA polymerase/3'-5' exonuclease PolX [Syntrophales bacterium]